MRYLFICVCTLSTATSLFAQGSSSAKNVVVFKESGRFGGWPANNGMWSWGNELLVGFSLGYFKNVERGHAIDPAKPSTSVSLAAWTAARHGRWRPRLSSPRRAKNPSPTTVPGGFISLILTLRRAAHGFE